MANTVLRKDYSGAGNKQKQTISVWVKRCAGLGGNQAIFSVRHTGNANYYGYLRFKTDNSLQYYTNTPGIQMRTNRLFRDINAWYHIVITLDTTQSTEADRLKIYINGVQETSFQTATYPSQNAEVTFGDDYRHEIGSYDSSYYFEGVMSYFYFITNTAYQASTFGSTDSVTGEWKINTSPTVTYATNSFFILKDGNSVTDQSGNSNDFTLGAGTLTKTEDCPSNVFATMNPLSAGSDMTFTFGSTGIRNDVNTWNSGLSTIAPATGKYYWEVYVHGGGDNNTGVSLSSAYGGTHSEVDAGRVVYSRNGYIYREGLSGQSNVTTGVTYGDGDYIGVAFDTENGVLTFYKNGTAVTNGATTDTSFLPSNNEYLVQCGLYNGGEFRFNFGNGAFGSTQLTGTTYQGDGNIGIFKYEPPTGYTALSTKGLNE